jgi:TolB-like protein/Flp pilus assembly protein TadD
VTRSTPGVFLSYASEDAGAARLICDALRAAGVDVWFDQSELRGGAAWDLEIRRQIAECALIVCIISKTTQSRPEGYFRLEWKLAVDRSNLMAEEKAFIVPVVIDSTKEAEALVPTRFREVQWTVARSGEVPAEFVQRIAALLRQPISRRPWAGGLPAGESPNAAGGRSRRGRLAWIAGIALASILAVALTERSGWLYHSRARSSPEPAAVSNAVTSAPTATAMSPDEKSVAVLPFVDMSEGHDQEYFTDGLSEELIDLLVKVRGLRVPARTSSFYYKGRSATIGQIAQELHVTNIIEGSVRKSGNHLRITAQLVRADTGYHLWSETFDRNLDDIFRTQDQIANAVVNALKISLRESDSAAVAVTANPDAYALYLQARARTARHTKADIDAAALDLQRVLKIDANFAPAWALYAKTRVMLVDLNAIPYRQAREETLAASNHAIAADPNLGVAHLAMVRYHLYFDWDYKAAAQEMAIARRLDPFDSDTLRYAGSLAITLGQTVQARELYLSAVDRDPLDAANFMLLGKAETSLGHFAEARAALQRTIELAPGLDGHFLLGEVLRLSGDLAGALREYEQETDEDSRLTGLALVLGPLGREHEANDALKSLENSHGDDDGYFIATIYASRGDFDHAFAWLDRAYETHDLGLTSIMSDPAIRGLAGDPRYRKLLRRMNLVQ